MDWYAQLNAIGEKLDKIIELMQNGNTSTRESLPAFARAPMLYEYIETWLREVKAPRIKPKSLSILRNGFVRYIKPAIKNKPMHKYSSSEIYEVIESVPYSYMKQVVYSIFAAVFKRAYLYDLITENPMEKLDYVKHRRKKGKALTEAEQTAFVKAIENEPTRPLWLFLLLSGCRSAEAIALKWTDIDTENGRILIRGTKTEYSERYIPIFPQLRELLSALPHTGELVFPFTYRQMQCVFYRVRKKYGFQFRMHDMRHTFATRCLENGITLNTVSKWLGHKSPFTTAGIYQHVQGDFERQEATKFNPHI